MELDWGHNSMSSHGGACHVMAGHVFSWQGMSSHGGACLLMAGHVISGWGISIISWKGMSSHGRACLVMAAHVFSWRGMSAGMCQSSHRGAYQIVAMWFQLMTFIIAILFLILRRTIIIILYSIIKGQSRRTHF